MMTMQGVILRVVYFLKRRDILFKEITDIPVTTV